MICRKYRGDISDENERASRVKDPVLKLRSGLEVLEEWPKKRAESLELQEVLSIPRVSILFKKDY